MVRALCFLVWWCTVYGALPQPERVDRAEDANRTSNTLNRPSRKIIARKLAQHSLADQSAYIFEVKNLSQYYLSFLNPRLQEQRQHACALFTVVHNEMKLLSLWVKYHAKYVHPRDIYVLDDGSTDDCTYGLSPDVAVIEMPKRDLNSSHSYDVKHIEGYGSQLFAHTVLLAGYPCYISLDVDEILIADPGRYPQGLRQLVSQFVASEDVPYKQALGKDILHVSSGNPSRYTEDPLRWDRPILAQRSFWVNNTVYDKIIMSKIPIRYMKGKHRAAVANSERVVARNAVHINGYPVSPTVLAPYNNETWLNISPINDELILAHLHSIDARYCSEREAHKYFNLHYYFEGERKDGTEWRDMVNKKKVCGKAMVRMRRDNRTNYKGAERISDKWKDIF